MPLRKKPLSEYTSTPKDRERARIENSFTRFLTMFCNEHPDFSELKVSLYEAYNQVRTACPWGLHGGHAGWEFIHDWSMVKLLDAAGFTKGSRMIPVKSASGLVSYVPRVVYIGLALDQAKVDSYIATQKIAKEAQDAELATQRAIQRVERCQAVLEDSLAGLAADPRTAHTKRIDTDSGITYIRSECDTPASSTDFVSVGGAIYARALIATVASISKPFTKAGQTAPCTHIVTFNNPQLRAVFVTRTDATEIITQLTGGKQNQ